LDALISSSIVHAYSTEDLTCVHCTNAPCVLSSNVACRLLACLLSFASQLQQVPLPVSTTRQASLCLYQPHQPLWSATSVPLDTSLVHGTTDWPTTLSRPCCLPAATEICWT